MPDIKPYIRSRLLPGIVIAIIAMAVGIWAARLVLQHQIESNELDATRFPEAMQLQPFSLADHNGSTFDNTTLQQHWSFLFFGYTHCPDVCPTTLSVLNSVAQRLQDVSDNIRFVMVTLDPERDTPEKLGKFVTWFNGEFIGVTGTAEGLEQLTGQLGIMHMRVNGDTEAKGYLIDHTAAVFLFDPDGNYHAVISPPLTVDAIAGDFVKMFRAYH